MLIPHEMIEETINKTEEVAATENKARDAMRGGMDALDAYLKYGKFRVA